MENEDDSMRGDVRCLVRLADGQRCGASAVFFDEDQGELICEHHAPAHAPRAADILAARRSPDGRTQFRRVLQALIRNLRSEKEE